MPLTDSAIRALKPKDKRYTKTDDKGLALEVYPTGGMLWQFRYRLDGKQERVTLGRYPALSLKIARAMRDEAATQVALGQSPAAQKQRAKAAQGEAVTVSTFGERFFKEIVAKDRRDTTIPRRYFDKSIVPAIGSKLVQTVTTEDVRAIIWRKKDAGYDAAAGQVRGLLKRLFDYAMTCGLATSNPVLALPMRHVHKPKARDRVLSSDEIRAFLRATYESNIRRQFKIGVHLLLLTMVRKSALLQARWSEVDLDEGLWHIPPAAEGRNTKSDKPHLVYLSRQVVELFRQLKPLAGGSELVIPGRSSLNKPFAHNAINSALKVALQGQEIAAFVIHDFRRTASTTLHETGWPSDVVEKALNHVIGGVRGVYNKAEYADQRREMLQVWADHVDSLLNDGTVIMGRFRQRA
ncbi:tyrosine-type recombinase/integrase [Roseateles violae]|uniref:Integrase arm-type DNA-binding domain-containing protein n=1 Tax=Roseateles violae TaxID=3058042 RepID=A0ABT8DL23_9BURK|nr:integrase arm-type DNA-binding domain-containing protein [Pelomonas sp. PFR6]MDN3919115.1 integrase arm-type DNA-binding domain-containing protein [Pelomonas sp. PFR6]